MKYILMSLFAVIFATPSFAAAGSVTSMAICVNKAGQFVVKTKCSKAETKITASNIGAFGLQGPVGPQGVQGPQGPAGVSASATQSCRVVTGSSYTAETAANVRLSCSASEYLLTWGYGLDRIRLVTLRYAEPLYLNNDFSIVRGMDIMVQGEITSSYYGEDYTLFGTIVCCTK